MLRLVNNIVFYTQDKIVLNEDIPCAWEMPGRNVFTSMRIKSNRGPFFKSHIKRLQLGANYLFGQQRIDDSLEDKIRRGLNEINVFFSSEYRLKVVLNPKLIMMATNVEEGYCSYSAINLMRAQNKKSSLRPSFLKVDDYKKSMEEIDRIKKKGYDDILYLDCADHVMECSTSNIFFTSKKKIYTPKLRPGILAGITRQKLIDSLEKKGISVCCLDISWKQLHDADEIWQTNSIKGIRPVKMLEEKILTRFQKENSLTGKIIHLFNNYCQTDHE